MKEKRIIIFDTTLRDGEQSPGIHLNAKEKLEIARQLARLGVDVIEAGFPVSSPGDFEAVNLIARTIKGPIIAGLARTLRGDIERCWEAVKEAEKPCIHVFVGTSPVHRESIMRKSEKEILAMAVDSVKIAKDKTFNVEFSPMDASRTEFDFLCEVIEKTIDSGATTINIPDTVGYALPDEFGGLIKKIINSVVNINEAILSVHCHDDLGLAMANSLAAILAGARQVECAVNGIGERAGNLSLEEIVMALKARKDFLGFTTGIDTKEIYRTSQLVSHLTGMAVAHNKAIIGENAFAHSSGIHQDGVLKKRETFEIITPASVGFKESKIILTSRSGRHAVKHRLKELGYRLDKEELERIYVSFKELADKKKEIFDEDLETIVQGEISTVPEVFHLKYIHVTSGSHTVPTATVKLEKTGAVFEDAACGDGPVDAACRAIDRITKVKGELLDYSLRAVTSGKDALGEVTVKVREGDNVVTERGSSTDIIEASARAYLKAVNKIMLLREKNT
jgi:2-isopropylmalate synthase